MSLDCRSSSSEARPLLEDAPPSYHSLDSNDIDDNSSSPDYTDVVAPPLNQFSTSHKCWILAGLWSGVFLGALDGMFYICLRALCSRQGAGTIVATLLAPIGSDFNKSNQSSYIGTAYLLSVCCFTPLYGQYEATFFVPIISELPLFSGRLSEILGRKGAMLLALSLFGTSIVTPGEA